MKLNLLLACGCLASLTVAIVYAETDAVREAIEKFEKSRRKPPAEVTVVLEPPPPPAVPVPEVEEPAQTTVEPVHTPETAAAETDPADLTPPPQPPPSLTEQSNPEPVMPQPEQPAAESTPPPTGVAVSVRKVETGLESQDAATPKILAPFPAKPLAPPPSGWRIEPSDNILAFTENVKLENGKSITLSVKPHILVPDADGFLSFTVPEPGYDPGQEYQQNSTIGAVLSRSLEQMDEDSKQLGAALDQLQQLLISLPKPKAQPVSNIEP